MELSYFREKTGGKRETNIENVLLFISNQVWKHLFGRAADGVEQSNMDEDEFWLNDDNPITTRFVGDISVNTAAFTAGIIEGLLYAIEFPAVVDAHYHTTEEDETDADKVVYSIKFTKEAREREAA